MPDKMEFAPPEITDDDVRWVCAALHLPDTAFGGATGHDPRMAILKSLESMDVEACPGSGKTTLLVAKLAILARRWAERTRGLCVLSHTNVARREIEARLGGTTEGRRLLAYPHFVGTIHGFVNEFLATPWLRSKGLRVRLIDDDVCQERRWRRLKPQTKVALEKNHHDPTLLRIRDPQFGLGVVKWGKRGRSLGETTPTYLELQKVCKAESAAGFYCYDEMFVWASDLLDRAPELSTSLRHRFPRLFIDEVQDNSDAQSELLWRIFMRGEAAVTRQRFGDSNQAIYEHGGRREGASSDPFPGPGARRDIASSHRFGASIAHLADPVAFEPQALEGVGPSNRDCGDERAGKHAVFLFDQESIGGVLEAYATYLATVFSDDELSKGVFKAVGGVHRPGRDGRTPGSVSDYWAPYDHKSTGAEAASGTLVQYVMSGRALGIERREAHFCVERIAEGVLRLAEMLNRDAGNARRSRRHRHILELLKDRPGARSEYVSLMGSLSAPEAALTRRRWEDEWAPAAAAIAAQIGRGAAESAESVAFLEWAETGAAEGKTGENDGRNIFRYPQEEPKVAIQLGSIHSVKGETHTSTLVLETYFRRHQLSDLKPWLLGDRRGGRMEGPERCTRLRQHYVAMTRASHLLCLALPESAFSAPDVARLGQRGWRVGRIGNRGCYWL